jgi:hypothetical protein
MLKFTSYMRLRMLYISTLKKMVDTEKLIKVLK